MSKGVAVNFAWLLPHLPALESDFSVYHRVDDMFAMPVSKWARLLGQLPIYGGAFAASMQADSERSTPSQLPSAQDGELTDEQVKAKFRQILIEKYPEHAAGGIKEVTAEEMEREVRL